MKKIFITLITLYSINLIVAQQSVSDELVEITNKVHKLDLDKKIIETFNASLSNYEQITDKILFNHNFEVNNNNGLINMLEYIVYGRKEGKVSEHIWDNLGVGIIFKDRILENGRINTDDFIGELPVGDNSDIGNFDVGFDVGSESRGKNNKVDPSSNKL